MEFLVKLLAFFVAILFLVVIISLLVMLLTDVIKDFKELNQKHRSGKPPSAKCYCSDCRYWDKCNEKCLIHDGWWTTEDGFCWEAEPRTDFEDYIR